MKLVILDRDGVINHNTDYRVLTPEQWEPIPGSLEAIAKLKKAGFVVVVATNQSIIANNIVTNEDLLQIHGKMQSLLEKHQVSIDQIFYCPHASEDNCYCRKPKPGMLLKAAEMYKVDFSKEKVPFVGDSLIDLQAAAAAKALPVLVKTGHGDKTLSLPQAKEIIGVQVFDNLKEFVDYWLRSF